MLAMSLLTRIAKVYHAYALLPLEGMQAIGDTSAARNKDTKAKKQQRTALVLQPSDVQVRLCAHALTRRGMW